MLSEHYNNLTAAETERLAMLIEEAGEVIMGSCNIAQSIIEGRDITPFMMEQLAEECADFLAVSRMMHDDLARDLEPFPRDVPAIREDASLHEHLVSLSSAASAVIHIGSKTLRHGYGSHHPKDPTRNNRKLLASSVVLLCRIIDELRLRHGLKQIRQLDEVISRKMKYSHHQNGCAA